MIPFFVGSSRRVATCFETKEEAVKSFSYEVILVLWLSVYVELVSFRKFRLLWGGRVVTEGFLWCVFMPCTYRVPINFDQSFLHNFTSAMIDISEVGVRHVRACILLPIKSSFTQPKTLLPQPN